MTSPESSIETRQWRGLALVSLAGMCWGTIGPAVQIVVQRTGLSALTIAAYRASIAVLVLVLCLVVARRLSTFAGLTRTHGRRIVLVGLLTAIFQLLFFVAVAAAGVSLSTVISMGFAPALLLVLSSARERRRPSPDQWLTVGLAIVGLLLVSLVGGGREHATNPTLGVLSALGSGAAFAMAADTVRPLSQRLDTLTASAATMSVGALVLVPAGLLPSIFSGQPLTTSDAPSWVLIVYLGSVTMAAAQALLYTGLRTIPSGAAVVAALLEPVTALVIAAAFLDEHLTLAGMVGCLMIIAAIATLGRLEGRPPPH